MKSKIIEMILMYLYGVILRYSIGTSHCERFQTKYKTYKFPKILQIIIFASVSKQPVSFISITAQLFSITEIICLLLNIFNYITAAKIFVNFQMIMLIMLGAETLIKDISYKGECKSSDGRILMDFDSGNYTLISNGKKLDGYLELYFPDKYRFYDNKRIFGFKDNILDSGTYKIKKSGKTKIFYFYSENR